MVCARGRAQLVLVGEASASFSAAADGVPLNILLKNTPERKYEEKTKKKKEKRRKREGNTPLRASRITSNSSLIFSPTA